MRQTLAVWVVGVRDIVTCVQQGEDGTVLDAHRSVNDGSACWTTINGA